MNTIKILTSIIAICAFLTACNSPNNMKTKTNKLFDNKSKSYVAVVAHRSCWQSWPENSIKAANACLASGVDMVEVDVRLTKDNKLVVMHDETLDRTTSGKGKVSDFTLEEILALTLKDRDGVNNKMTPYHPPSLKQFLQALKGKVMINLDLKESLFEDAYKIVQQLNVEDQVLIKMHAAAKSQQLVEASFHNKVKFMPILYECNEFYLERNIYCTKDLANVVTQYSSYNPVAFEIVFENDQYLKSGAETIRNAGLALWVNTLFEKMAGGRLDEEALNDPEKNWGQLIDLGVNVIQTNRPKELIQYLEARQLR